MPFIIADRVRETSTTVGTGSIALGGAVVGYQTFDAVLDTNDTTFYVFADQAGGPNWEVGIGTFTAPSTLARTTIISSSNGGSIVNFGSGTKDVFISLPASKTNVDDQPNVIEVNSSSAALRITQTGAGNALLVEDSANPDSSPFVIDASGNVGVGTTTPAVPLDVAGTVRSVAATPFYNLVSGSTDMGGIYSPDTSSVNILARSSKSLVFMSGGVAERMRIDASGNVGIGTSSPGTPLDVRFATNPPTDNGGGIHALRVYTNVAQAADVGGAVSFGGQVINSNSTGFAFGQIAGRKANSTSGDFAGYLSFATNTAGGSMSERMRIDGSGNVGIGTSSPGYRLDVGTTSGLNVIRVGGGNTGPDNGGALYCSQNGVINVAFGNASAILGGGYSADALLYATNNTRIWAGSAERMRIDTSGNVGIGTSSPLVTLDVNGNIRARAASGEGGELQLNNPDNASVGAYFDVSTADVTRWFTIRNNSLHQIGQLAGTGGTVAFYTAASERMRVDSAGNVGIGLSSPTARLHVAGTIQSQSGSSVAQMYSDGGAAYFTSVGAFPSLFLTNGSERMRISGSGADVSIGTSSIFYANANRSTMTIVGATDALLALGGGGAASGYVYGSAATMNLTADSRTLSLQATGSNIIQFITGVSERMRLDASGNLGIGTSSPADRLSVVSASQPKISVQDSNGGAKMIMQAQLGVLGVLGSENNVAVSFVVNNTERARITTGGDFQFNSGYGSVATAYGCRAWVNFKVSGGTPGINASGNISSITDQGVGDYSPNFSTAMPDAFYSIQATAKRASSNSGLIASITWNRTASTTQCHVTTGSAGSSYTLEDASEVHVAVFR